MAMTIYVILSLKDTKGLFRWSY